MTAVPRVFWEGGRVSERVGNSQTDSNKTYGQRVRRDVDVDREEVAFAVGGGLGRQVVGHVDPVAQPVHLDAFQQQQLLVGRPVRRQHWKVQCVLSITRSVFATHLPVHARLHLSLSLSLSRVDPNGW
jgi:hypothetical protein